jgi:ubiquinone/menaquinone biosynthesis C-methylase UbiE
MADHICPVWVGYLLANPVRRLVQNPERILRPYVKEGMTTLDAGCAMGFFSLPLARMTGPQGRVICVDVQKRMIDVLAKKAGKAGLSNRMVLKTCSPESLYIEEFDGQIDFALAFAVVHESTNPGRFFKQIHVSMKQDAKCLVAEPLRRVRKEDMNRSVLLAEQAGFQVLDQPALNGARAVLLQRR